jgi:MFS family permease
MTEMSGTHRDPPPPADPCGPFAIQNVRRFIAFRIFFNSRFYYPVFTVLFLDYGLTLAQFALLNSVWAATIVCLEVPTGALADVIGRRKLVVLAAALMVVEIALLCFAPRGNPALLLTALLLNRLLSGAAEAAASGADEAIAYDSLKGAGLESAWPLVLEKLMRLQALAYMGAMVVGAAVYDPDFMQAVLRVVGWKATLSPDSTLRLPPLLTLLSAFGALISAWGLREEPAGQAAAGSRRTVEDAVRTTLLTGRWILRTPFALAVILAGMCFDHCLRLLITLNSQYYRLIQLPEAVYGLIGSGLALLGLFMPRIARGMAQRRTPAQNLAVMVVMTTVGLAVLSRCIPYYGLLPVVLLVAVLYLNNFFQSHYLNRITSSENRATVLSFKGLSFNLAYGLIGLFYSFLIDAVRKGLLARSPSAVSETALQNQAFVESLAYCPWYFLACMAILLFIARRGLRHSTQQCSDF